MSRAVQKEDLDQLVSFENTMINDHLEGYEKTIKRLVNKRGKSFIEAIKRNSLNYYEAILISSYADFMASDVNGSLRSLDVCRKEHILFEDLLNRALEKMQPESNSTVYVMFSSCDEEEIIYQWWENRIGESIQFPNFLSSSRRKWEDHGFYLEIQTTDDSSGKYIGSLTNKEKLEEEVTFISNTSFVIKKVDRSSQAIYLAELPKGTKGKYLLKELYYMNIRDKEEGKV